MLPQKNRLKKSSDFDRAYKKGKHIRGKYGKLVIYDRGDNKPARFGVVIPAKLGKAARRNRAKRQVREAMRELIESELPKYMGLDITLIFWGIDFSFEEIKRWGSSILSRFK